ncbi:RagB/SusD family nutrient uptake outer membrane protein [Algibacter mikhailovii]|uniref:RagB/SusD family nutrient uptake outer membrane protein n=1 Tax=Algibacter mikhailovii TaxID=425498 RepID=UPI002494808F|nr:RagB/SusD family nutrient uptake outer membrane protein [Algibacter mikhailovii]
MKHNIIKIFTIFSIAIVSLSSCDSYLDLEPQDTLIQQEFWQSKEQVSSAVAGIYAAMNQSGFTDKVLYWGELRAEMLLSANASNDANNMLKNYIIPTNGLLNWANFYQVINHCNLVLEFGDQAKEADLSFTQQELDRYKAEAIALRSLAYFILVKNFKEVPLVLTATATSQVDFYPSKSTEAEIIDQIISDLNSAISALNLGFEESAAHDKGRMTKGGALALLADVYLWNNQFNECIETCERITNLGKYSLVDGVDWFNQLFFEGNSREGIFELQFDDINRTYTNAFYVGSPDFIPYIEINQLYEEFPNDVRGNLATYERTLNSVFKFGGVDNTGEYRGQDEFYNNFIFYRYADVLLMQAEAYILSSENKNLDRAYDLINLVHIRATSQPFEKNLDEAFLINALLSVRQKEFAFEGKRWYDLLRIARRNDFAQQSLILDLVDIKAGTDDYEQILSFYSDTESYFLPIPQNEINLNKNLVQNPYYEN